MCRSDDFPPYDGDGTTPAFDSPDFAPLEQAPRATPLGSFPGWTFRTLGPEEERRFRSWARENFTPGAPINPLWHPVVRDECERMEGEKG